MGWVSTERNHDEQPITVGVIDDDPMICQMMRLILEDYSSGRISVAFACTNAADAIEHASHNPPDVVLADIAMPGMDGIEATRQLRMLPDPPHVLILTSLSPNNTVERAIEAGGRIRIENGRSGRYHPPCGRRVRRGATVQSGKSTAAHRRFASAPASVAAR